MTTPTKVEAPLGTDKNGSEANRDLTNSHASVIGIMLYLESNTRADISFSVYQCDQFTHNTKAFHGTGMESLCRYLKGTKNKGMVLNPYNKMVVDFCSDAYFAGLWGYENTPDPICARNRTGSVVTFFQFSSIVGVKTTYIY